MCNLYSVTIEWIDDNSQCDVLIAEYDGVDSLPAGYSDDDIFFYGMSEKDVLKAIETGEPCENEWRIIHLNELICDIDFSYAIIAEDGEWVDNVWETSATTLDYLIGVATETNAVKIEKIAWQIESNGDRVNSLSQETIWESLKQ